MLICCSRNISYYRQCCNCIKYFCGNLDAFSGFFDNIKFLFNFIVSFDQFNKSLLNKSIENH